MWALGKEDQQGGRAVRVKGSDPQIRAGSGGTGNEKMRDNGYADEPDLILAQWSHTTEHPLYPSHRHTFHSSFTRKIGKREGDRVPTVCAEVSQS